MSKRKKLYQYVPMRRSDANVPFEGLFALLMRIGFNDRIRGDHNIIRGDHNKFTQSGVEEIPNLQPRDGRGLRLGSAFGLTVGVISFFVGCVVIPNEYINIPNRIRLSTESLCFPDGTNVLRFAAEKGGWQSRIRLSNVAVRKGTLTFHGKDGSVSFTTNNTLAVKMQMLDEVIFPMKEQQISFYLDEQSMYIDGGIDPKEKWKWIEQNGETDLRKLSPNLIFHSTNGYWLVDIPFEKTEDFDGHIGDLSIIPNWYDGKK